MRASGRGPRTGLPSASSPEERRIEEQRTIAPSLYRELRRLAARKMRFERGNHTLQPTALVNEAWLRLADAPDSVWRDRSHFLALAAREMRHILVDHARAHCADKRGAGAIQVTLDDGLVATSRSPADVLAVDEALSNLSHLDPRQAEILELHFFAGMTYEEIAAALGISTRTVKRDSQMARAWIKSELSKQP
jgi:RNA polymerase sigma-70 factor, ECF subfamily